MKSSSRRPIQVSAIIPAAGSGTRLKNRRPKPLVRIGGIPLLILTLRALKSAWRFRRMVMAVEPARMPEILRLLKLYRIRGVELVAGGQTRAGSVLNGLATLGSEDRIVLVHDVARPFVTRRDVERVILEASVCGAAILAQRATSTVKEADPSDRVIRNTHDRNRIWLAQTPQVFRAQVLKDAYEKLGGRAAKYTDEAGLVEASGLPVRVVEGSAFNLKITTPEDLKLADALMGSKLVK